jgi:crotonobetainyl-CoA:carnitine CoA-transferase CaiB-like acyl-CoA transferase
MLVSADFRYLWSQLVKVHGLSDPADKDTPLADKIRMRRQRASEFMQALASWQAVEDAMAAMNIAWGKVRDPAEIGQQATIAARDAIVQVDDRAGGTRPIPQSPYRFSDAKSGVRGGAPHRGEHNYAVLAQWLGKSSEEVDSLLSTGVLDAEDAVSDESQEVQN